MRSERRLGRVLCILWGALGVFLGCDSAFDVRMDIRAGPYPMSKVVNVSEADRFEGPPIQGVATSFRVEGGSPVWQKKGISGPDGVVEVGIIPGGPCTAASAPAMNFVAEKSGYSPVTGTFRLGLFPNVPSQRPDVTVLVVMKPTGNVPGPEPDRK